MGWEPHINWNWFFKIMYPGPLQLIRDVFISEYIYIINTLQLNQHKSKKKKKRNKTKPTKQTKPSIWILIKNSLIKCNSSLSSNNIVSHLLSMSVFWSVQLLKLLSLGGRAGKQFVHYRWLGAPGFIFKSIRWNGSSVQKELWDRAAEYFPNKSI